jgi:hypothetical protein
MTNHSFIAWAASVLLLYDDEEDDVAQASHGF